MPPRKTHAARRTILDRQFTIEFRKREKGDSPQYLTYCGLYVSPHRLETGDKIECVSCLGQAKINNPLKIDIQTDTITISTVNDNIEVAYWCDMEWMDDPDITPAIANAIHMAHTDPDRLIHMNSRHMLSQYEIRRRKR